MILTWKLPLLQYMYTVWHTPSIKDGLTPLLTDRLPIWHAVAGKINAEGQVEGTCVGTGMAFDPAFYYYRPVNVYAAHGYGPVLWAGAEMIRLLKNQYPQMNDSAVQYYQVKQKTTAPIFAIDTEEKRD